jgi:hypothetical protein
VNIAGSESASFQIAELIEQEQWMIACAGIMPVPDVALLLTPRRFRRQLLHRITCIGKRLAA